MITQPFRCNSCGYKGEVELPNDSTISNALNTMKREHEVNNPNCSWEPKNITILEPKITDD